MRLFCYLCLLVALPFISASEAATGADSSYAITSVLEVLAPAVPKDIEDDFQKVKIIAVNGPLVTLEVTYFPYRRVPMVENHNWKNAGAGLQHYLTPTPSENWDAAMRIDLINELGIDGINAESLGDVSLVQQVSKWALKRSKTSGMFKIWSIHYPNGIASVFPPLRDAFLHGNPPGVSERSIIENEALGKSMYYSRSRGTCTSTAAYLATVLRPLGIPTRIIICIPPFDCNDPAQADLFFRNVHDETVKASVRNGLKNAKGFVNHVFNEVYVGGRWQRLNYDNLNQGLLDERYFGILLRIGTIGSLSEAPLAETWGMRFYRYPSRQPLLSSVNPYRLVSIRDNVNGN